MTPFVANAVTGGDPNITPGQTAAIAGIATLTGGLLAGLAGQNAMAGATAAQNEAMNNCLGHPESCLQLAKNALSSASDTATNAFNQLAFHMPDDVAQGLVAGANVPAMESATNLDLLKGVGNVGLNLSSFSLPGMPDYTRYFQYNSPLIGGIGETYGVLGMNSLVAGGLSSAATKGAQPVTAENFFDGSQYTSKVLNQASSGDYHGFPQSVDGFSGDGTVAQIVGGDGVTRWKLDIPGSYNGKAGVFEYIRNPDGTINHRLFVPN